MRKRSIPAILLLTILALCGCKRTPKTESTGESTPPDGEPQRYSAVIVRTVNDGTGEQTSEFRIVRSGELTRQEWTEGGERRALIWRPDLGKVFSLSLDKSTYSESSMQSRPTSDAPRATPEGTDGEDRQFMSEQAINQAFAALPQPESTEMAPQPDQKVGDYACTVVEQRLTFADGRVESKRIYRAGELGGLVIRVESEGVGGRGRVKVITELRSISLEVSPQEFEVPETFQSK